MAKTVPMDVSELLPLIPLWLEFIFVWQSLQDQLELANLERLPPKAPLPAKWHLSPIVNSCIVVLSSS
jgi:hypothetical protein